MKRFVILLTALLWVAAFQLTDAEARSSRGGARGWGLVLSGNVNLSFPSSPGNTYSTGIGLGGGAGILKGIGRDFSVELGVHYSPRVFTEVSGNRSAEARGNWIQIPLLFKVHFARVIQFGVGGYLSNALGNLQVTTNGTSESLPYSSVAFSTLDAGLSGSLGAAFPLGAKSFLGIVTEGRFHYGLLNGSTAGALYYTDVQVFFGLQIGGMK